MVDDQIENSKLLNKTKNNLNLFILNLITRDILQASPMVLQFAVDLVVLINSWGSLHLKTEKREK